MNGVEGDLWILCDKVEDKTRRAYTRLCLTVTVILNHKGVQLVSVRLILNLDKPMCMLQAA